MNTKLSRRFHTASLTRGAIIAALYIILTFIANAMGLANYAIQLRFSESLCILPYFTKSAIPGLFIGCLLSNILTGCALPDIIFGSIATLLGSIATYLLRKYKWAAPIGPILSNTLIIPFVLLYAYGIKPLWFSFITVAIGEFISCGFLGILLLKSLEKYTSALFEDRK